MSWRGGSTRRWRAKRRRVLERDGYRCKLRLDGCTTKATTVHHQANWRGDPGDVPEHLLMAACTKCNGKVGDPTRHDPKPRSGTAW